MSNFAPEVEASTMEPPFNSRITFEHDQRDAGRTHRINFTADRKWSIVGFEYGSAVVSTHDTLGEAREALAGMVAA